MMTSRRQFLFGSASAFVGATAPALAVASPFIDVEWGLRDTQSLPPATIKLWWDGEQQIMKIQTIEIGELYER